MKNLFKSLCFFVVALSITATSLAEEAQPEAPTLSNTIRWATSSEVRNFGYDVYRAENKEGPFERITEMPIAGHGTTDIPQHYHFTDTTIEADTAYFYYVESISMDGERERFTPVYGAKPKSNP